ncbi:MAG: aminoacyl-tRNA hydrolase [Bacilli bacterium]|nr:aminoacyl-tRNA hydrolase [Bacilli bacterium]
MKLIVGLGNPGREYEKTRHNMGFLYIDFYASKNNLDITKKKFNGLYVDFTKNGEKIILLKPQSYMNLSGEVVKKFVDYFNIDIKDILIICDDLDTALGKYRLRASGSPGGHNGLKDIELLLGTPNYSRLKIGISHNRNIDTKDYVLSKLDNDSLKVIEDNREVICNIIDDFLDNDMETLMSRYNRK